MIKYKLHVSTTHEKTGLPPWYWFTQIGNNGKVLLTSETYRSKRNRMKGIRAASAGNHYVIVNEEI